MSLEVKDKTRVRLVFLGAAGVGKTALIRRFLQGSFEPKHRRTVEELHSREYEACGGGTLTVEILDTSGSYSFPAMRRLSIQSGDAFALVCAVDDPQSLEAVKALRDEILEVRGADRAPAAVVVVGNKTDRQAERRLAREETLATVELDWNHSYVEASAKQDANVAEVFRELLRQAHHLPGRLSPALRRRRETIPKDSGFRPPMNKTNSCSLS